MEHNNALVQWGTEVKYQLSVYLLYGLLQQRNPAQFGAN